MKIFKPKFYSLKNILSRNALYNVIIGERSNGKTFAVLAYALERYIRTGEQLAIIRRWSEDYTGKRGSSMFNAVVESGLVSRLTRGEYTGVHYFGSRWYLSSTDEKGKKVIAETPFAYGFAISGMEHDKSTAYPEITTIMFDEFLTRTTYLTDEFVLFMNCLSTIIRQRENVKIFMLGNTVTKACPYFKEMGLKHIKDMQPGDIDLYTYGDSGLTVAVELTKPNEKGKQSDKYFAFDNPKLSMITGGTWEMEIYPHCPRKYRPKDVAFTYYIRFDGDTLGCDIVCVDGVTFTFIRPQTMPIKDGAVVFSGDFSPDPNHFRRITNPQTNLQRKIFSYFQKDLVFYADNETGEIVRNYLNWSY